MKSLATKLLASIVLPCLLICCAFAIIVVGLCDGMAAIWSHE